MANLIQKIKELVQFVKDVIALKELIASITPELKEDILGLAKDIDEIIVKVEVSPSLLDDKAIPLLKSISGFLKKIAE